MKSSLSSLQRSVAAFSFGVLALVGPRLLAEDPAAAASQAGDKAANQASDRLGDYRTEPSDLNKAQVKAAFEKIDAELDHLDNLIDSAPSDSEKAAAKIRYEALKERRDQLKKEFDRARYDAFKADLKAELDKASAWTKQTFSSQPAAASAAKETNSSANNSAAKIADYRADPSDANKAAVQSSIEQLDAQISLLESRVNTITDPTRKADFESRIKSFKDRRDELKHEFRQARFDALMNDIKGEWTRLTS
jgi:predicted  nucleic acid-binding Zn-ribbon protein